MLPFPGSRLPRTFNRLARASLLASRPRLFTVFGKFWFRPNKLFRRNPALPCPVLPVTSPLIRTAPSGHDSYARYLPSISRKQASCTPKKPDNAPCSNPICIDLRTRASPAPSRAAPKPARVVLQRYRARHDTHLPDRFGAMGGTQGLQLLHSSLEHEQASDKALARIAELEAEVDRLQAEHSVRGAGTNGAAALHGGSGAWWKFW
ncbi:uncharacterized protein SCHCODRAFT_02576564 [Schizophyllum commune H4-8]|nr:uncharacterized protein SCHCODRAFT_02576564 [Schizophyllum commune H4-8]KAI5894037.1 hypothetical protein SCHCODRAFT_02576564 [Schizophyllum commune H4-8]